MNLIYGIFNRVNGKVYIGQTNDFVRRSSEHRRWLKTKNKNENRHLISAWHKYGSENFDFIILQSNIPDLFITAYEQVYVDYYRKFKGVYNLDGPVDCPHRGTSRSQSFKEKLRNSKIGKSRPPHIQEMLRTIGLGKKHNQEFRDAISKRMRGRSVSAETREKLSLGKLGRKYTEEHRAAMRAGRLAAKLARQFRDGYSS